MDIAFYNTRQAMDRGYFNLNDKDEVVCSVTTVNANEFLEQATADQLVRLSEVCDVTGETVRVVGFSKMLPEILVIQTADRSVYEIMPKGRIYLSGLIEPQMYITFTQLLESE